jgi:hypothetical protein
MRLMALTPALALIATGCGYAAPSSVVSGTAVITQYASGVSWGSYATYDVDPVLSVLDGTGTVDRTCTIDATPLVNAIAAHMESRGYARYRGSGHADLQLKLSAYLGRTTTYYPGYCGWYPYYDCYPGWTHAGSYSDQAFDQSPYITK